jgi:hypothetical protein
VSDAAALQRILSGLWGTEKVGADKAASQALRAHFMGGTPAEAEAYERELYTVCHQQVVPSLYIPRSAVLAVLSFVAITKFIPEVVTAEPSAARQRRRALRTSKSTLLDIAAYLRRQRGPVSVWIGMATYAYFTRASSEASLGCALLPLASNTDFGQKLRAEVARRSPNSSKLIQTAKDAAKEMGGPHPAFTPVQVAALRYFTLTQV